jgi:hypothetical protein
VEYDHNSGKFTEKRRLKPSRFIIVSGLHALYLPQTRAQMDLKIYLDTQPALQRYWKMSRDIASRDYTMERILAQIKARQPDVERYIYPQKQYADLILRYYAAYIPDEIFQNTPDPDLLPSERCVYPPREGDCSKADPLSVQATFSASVDTELLILALNKHGVHVEYDYSEDLTRQTLFFKEIEACKDPIPYYQIARDMIPQLDEITLIDFNDSNNLYGVVKLLMVFLISRKLQGEF